MYERARTLISTLEIQELANVNKNYSSICIKFAYIYPKFQIYADIQASWLPQQICILTQIWSDEFN